MTGNWAILPLLVVSCLAKPEQVHLSFHGDMTKMRVSWITFEDAPSQVSWGVAPDNLASSSTGTSEKWADGPMTRFVHRAEMNNLAYSTRYYYKIEDRSFNFTTLSKNPQSYKVCIFGDLGLWHGNSTASIIRNGLAGKFDFIVHVGDISYDLHANNGTVGDDYMNQLEPLISTMPYMVIAGNHEDDGKNFSHYQKRFWMPDNGYGDNQFYSFNLGPVHWMGVSTENYGSFNFYGMEPVFTQYNWLKQDLQTASANRAAVPWILSYQHRPFYCSNENSAECKSFENRLVRKGWLDMPGLEDLFLDYGMDMGFWGHEHSYERNWPIADLQYWAGNKYMHNPPAPVYVLTGSAGCHTPDAWFGTPWGWSASRSNDYGYTIMTLANSTHMHFEQVSINLNEKVVDDFWVSKDLTHVNTAAMRAVLPSQRMKNVFCPPQIPACRKTLMQLNEEL